MNINELRELNSLFKEVKDKDETEFNSYVQLPDGVYQATVDDLEVTESKAGRPMLVISYAVSSGEYAGYIHKQFVMLAGNDETQTARNLNRFATIVKKLGIDTSSNDMPTIVAKLSNGLNKRVVMEITTTVAKNGNSYTNTSFDVVE